jgi:hypothetical protein
LGTSEEQLFGVTIAAADGDLLLGRCGRWNSTEGGWQAKNSHWRGRREEGERGRESEKNGQQGTEVEEGGCALIQIEFPFSLILEQRVRGEWSSYW